MATHSQTGRACEEQCIPNYHALIDEKKIVWGRENNNSKRKRRKKKLERAKERIINKRLMHDAEVQSSNSKTPHYA